MDQIYLRSLQVCSDYLTLEIAVLLHLFGNQFIRTCSLFS